MASSTHGIRRNAHRLVLVVIASVMVPVHAADQAPVDNGWDRIMSAPEGSDVRIDFRDGTGLTGRLVVARTDRIVVEDIRTGPSGVRTASAASVKDGLTIARADVASIALVSTPPTRDTPVTPASFDQLRVLVGAGQKVNVTDVSGARYSGTVVSLSSSTLTLRVAERVRDLREGDVATIRHRRGDSLGNGALWGLAAGFGTGMVMCGRCHVGPGAAMGLVFGGIGTGIGVGIDALIRGDVVVFQRSGSSGMRVSVAPQLAKSHTSVAVSIGF
jgi:hypothetical protein